MHVCKKELPANEMLTARRDFVTVQNKGKKWVAKGLVLQIYKNDFGIIRTGYTISKKVSKSAVKRNRVKRRLRSVVADVMPCMESGYDYILVGRKETLTRPYTVLVSDLKWCLKKMGLYHKAGN